MIKNDIIEPLVQERYIVMADGYNIKDRKEPPVFYIPYTNRYFYIDAKEQNVVSKEYNWKEENRVSNIISTDNTSVIVIVTHEAPHIAQYIYQVTDNEKFFK